MRPTFFNLIVGQFVFYDLPDGQLLVDRCPSVPMKLGLVNMCFQREKQSFTKLIC
jgi:hypothetical protein